MKNTIALSDKVIMNTYGRFPIVIVRGKGMTLWDKEGKEYLDFVSGLAVCNLGHCFESVVSAIKAQAEQLIHVSNLFYTEPQIKLAKTLTDYSFADRVFFCNSGAEANEAAIKLVRKYSKDRFGKNRYGIISMRLSFHGRTMATISATGQEKIHSGFEPLLEGFSYVPYDNIDALSEAVCENKNTCAVLLEPIQGEGGVNVPSPGFLKKVRNLCDEKDLLLIFDEVQTGFGRTGTLFAYEDEKVIPDIMTLAKSMGGGMSIGAALASEKVSKSFGPGTHASTFGGNPVACAAGTAVMETMTQEDFLPDVRQKGNYFKSILSEMAERKSTIRKIKGRGLMLGIELDREGSSVVSACLSRGLLINCTMENVLRFLPPLIVTKEEIDKAVRILDEVL